MYKTNKKIIHFLDAVLFTDMFIKSFEKISSNSVFYILHAGKLEASYLDFSFVELVDTSDRNNLFLLISKLNKEKPDAAFFHFLNADKEFICNELAADIKKVWCLWGHDLYENVSFIPYSLYETKTLQYLKKHKPAQFRFYNRPFSKFLLFKLFLGIKSLGFNHKNLEYLYRKYSINRFETISKMDIISYIVPKEIKILKKKFANKVYVHLYSDPTLPSFSHFTSFNYGRNILVGNSAAYTNNHLDSFEILKNFHLGDSKIIVPLSYGGDKNYIDTVIEKGTALFGNNFLPLKERLPLDKYSELLSTCSTAIMNQRRQQSGGNLFHLIGSGVNVFINKENGFYSYFDENGIKIRLIEHLSQEHINHPTILSENRKALLQLYSQEHYENEINQLLKILN